LAAKEGAKWQQIACKLTKCSKRTQVLKTEQLAYEKVTSINKTSNQLFVQTIINIFAVAIISTSPAFDSTFLCQKFYKRYKRRSLYIS
jgi:hypothetical protein